MRIAVDAMGGDFAPFAIVEGVVNYLKIHPENTIVLVGDESQIQPILKRRKFNGEGVEIVHTPDSIGMGDKVAAIHSVPNASILLSAKMVRAGTADAMVGLGNTAIVMASGVTKIGRAKGVERPPIAIVVPTLDGGKSVLLDVGAVADCTSEILKQFALLGTIMAETTLGISNPSVGLLSIGEEESKGNLLVRETIPLLKANPWINFTCSVEARRIFFGLVDVIVADGFAGNVALKATEGVLDYATELIKTDRSFWLPALMALPLYRKLRPCMSSQDYGGAPIIGLNGVCITGHGNSKPKAVVKAIEMAAKTVESGIVEAIKQRMG